MLEQHTIYSIGTVFLNYIDQRVCIFVYVYKSLKERVQNLSLFPNTKQYIYIGFIHSIWLLEFLYHSKAA